MAGSCDNNAGAASWKRGRASLHTRMSDVRLGSLENSKKPRMPCRNAGDLTRLWLWQDFHRMYLWSSCRLELTTWVTYSRRLWEEGAGSNLRLLLAESGWTLSVRFLFCIFCSSTQIILPVLRHGYDKSLECHPVVMCPRSYVPWRFPCLLTLPASLLLVLLKHP